MKTFLHLLVVLLCCFSGIVRAQCDMQANFTYTIDQWNIFTFNYMPNNPQGTIYNIEFGDGQSSGSTSLSNWHSYSADSLDTTYDVCLIVYLPGTSCADTICQQIVVPGTGYSYNHCQVDFTWSFPAVENRAQFTATTNGNPTNWIWRFGDGTGTGGSPNPSHVYDFVGNYTVCLTTYGNGCNDTVCHGFDIGTPSADTVCGVVFNDDNSNGIMDNNELPIPGLAVEMGNNITTDSTYKTQTNSDGYYQLVSQGTFGVGLYAQIPQGCFQALPQLLSSPGYAYYPGVSGYYSISSNNSTSGCPYNFGFNCNVVNICGKVFFDGDNNNINDTTESGLEGVHITLTSINGQVYNAYTTASGVYCITLPVDTYTVTASSNDYNSCAYTPVQHIVPGHVAGEQFDDKNFAIYCQPGLCNLAVTITPHSNVVPGFEAWYDVWVKNLGTDVSGGTANLIYDAGLSFVSANPAQSAHNASTQTLSFNLSNLMPGQSAYYYVKFNAPQSLALNTPIFNLTNVIAGCNDINLTNNVDTVHQHVTGSWDPNNKLAYVTNYETNPAFQLISSIDANQRIEYVINFQNEGNGPAVNVVVKDLISSDLDINSFELIGTSHDCQVTLTGNDANFKFSNIMLPAKVADEPNSHGFIKFAINAINNLPAGHLIADDAAIYFDFNEAVVTNESEVTLLEPTGINEVSNVTATIAPNPMNQYATIRLNNNSNEGFKLRVTDITGRIVSEQITSNNNLVFERNSLSAGMYTYQVIQSNKAVAKGKLVIQ